MIVYPDEARFQEVFNRIERFVETKYGIPVLITDVAAPFTGDLDGAEIKVDFDLDLWNAVFIVAHLFGHTVQWNLSPLAREIGTRVVQKPTDEVLQQLYEYEVEACRYSLQLFHDAGIFDLDQWLSDFAAADFHYLEHFYRTGEKRDLMSFWQKGSPVLTPLPIPAFRPTKWISRWDGVVL